MRRTTWLITAVLVLAAGSWCAAESVAGLPLHVKKLTPTVIRVWVGDTISSTAVVAFATSKGIVVVDTVGIPKVDAELRKVIARELGRSDFKVLVNTHEHRDHTMGNSAYADCTIVGQKNVGPGMSASAGDTRRVVEWYSQAIAESQARLAKLDPTTAEAKKLKEEATFDRLNLEVLQGNVTLVPPGKTFTDRDTLVMGDTTFEMYFVGGMHSSSDIAILVPEQGLLLTGDTMADTWLNETPGCLASFAARSGIPHDFPLWLANWDLILAQKDRIKLLLPGHWNGELSLKGAEDRVAYVRALWDGVNAAARAGKSLDDVQAMYKIEKRFPDLAKSPGCNTRNNVTTVAEMWKVVTGQESGAEKLYALLDAGAAESAVGEVLAERDKKQGKYFFDEAEINAQGYRFLRDKKVDKAITMFKVNVKLFPDSWNVYDSLGEAVLESGDTVKAAKLYEKSLTINPESKSGKDALARIQSLTASK
jgi:glyoxylase-like metal-dependent hydrolase (beta-lactamase superfamily II)